MADLDTISPQRISRLRPLSAILALIEARVGAVPPRDAAIGPAQGRTLAADVVSVELPPQAIALRDGFAVEAAAIADASAYAPVPLPGAARRIDAGEKLPPGADAVLPLDAVTLGGKNAVAAIAAIAALAPGEGVLPVGGDATPAMPLRRAGQRLLAVDSAVLVAAGIEKVSIRAPRICVARGRAAPPPPVAAAFDFLNSALVSAGAERLDSTRAGKSLEDALVETNSDAVFAVGGTGNGRRDDAVATLVRFGRVEAHGIAISPGETAAFGFAGERPVLLVPGRLDAALSIWLLIGRHLVAKLAGGTVDDKPVLIPLKRKVTSAIGMTELIPVSCAGGMAEPLASGYLSFTALARSDGWIVVPADSEGFPAGTKVAVTPWS